MRIEQFISEECTMTGVELEIYSEIFDLKIMDALSDNDLHRRIGYWLSQYFEGDIRGVFEEISKINIFEQSIVYETFILLIKSRRELKLLTIRIMKYQLELRCCQ